MVQLLKGRGSVVSPPNRFESLHVDLEIPTPESGPGARTRFYRDISSSVLNKNGSPDIPFNWSVNPYRGCEHGCAYCYARPTHEYLGWNSGLDFESKILVKTEAPQLLRKALSQKKWIPEPIIFSGVTDCYQPAERTLRLTRGCLEILAELRNPASIVTKSALVARDIDLLKEMAQWNGVRVFLSITTLDSTLQQKLEPRAASPGLRLETLEKLGEVGISTGVMVAPVIPGLTDHEIPSILKAAKAAGARDAGMVLLRLPYGVKEVFLSWLDTHAPLRRDKVESFIREMRGGELNQSQFGHRFHGDGPYAEQVSQMFRVWQQKLGLAGDREPLNTGAFRRPRPKGPQLELFAPAG